MNSNLLISLIDIGNTRIKISTSDEKTYNYDSTLDFATLKSLFDEVNFDKKIFVSCVKPSLEGFINDYFKNQSLTYLTFENATVKSPSSEIGSDILAALMGIEKENALLIMLGTATVFAVKENDIIQGVIITSGVKTSIISLINNTEKIKTFDVSMPKNILGLNTIEALNSGAIYGHASLIEGIIKRLNYQKDIYCLGGYAKLIVPLTKYETSIKIDQELIFKGLKKLASTTKNSL